MENNNRFTDPSLSFSLCQNLFQCVLLAVAEWKVSDIAYYLTGNIFYLFEAQMMLAICPYIYIHVITCGEAFARMLSVTYKR